MKKNEINNRNIFINSKFSRNIKDLFRTQYNQYYNKNRLNVKLRAIISKEKVLNDRKIKDFDYGKMFHLFKIDMRKFEDEQNKKRTFYKTLNEENLKFNKDYIKSYSTKIESNNINRAENNIKSKTFQKFYNKHKINLEQKTKKINNLFNQDPLLDSNNNINLFYMNKDLDNDYLYNNNDEALNYVNKLEQSVNEKSILNKIKNIINNRNNKKKAQKKFNFNFDSDDENIFDDYYLKNNETENNKSYKNKNIIMRNYINNIKNYNKTIEGKIDALNTLYKNKREKNKIYNLKSLNKNKKINFLNGIKNKNNKKIDSNQIENLYNEIVRIKKNSKKYEKMNLRELKFLYSVFDKNEGKKLKMILNENQILFNLDKNLVYTVNSFKFIFSNFLEFFFILTISLYKFSI